MPVITSEKTISIVDISLCLGHVIALSYNCNNNYLASKANYDSFIALYKSQIWADKAYLQNCSFVQLLDFTPQPLTNDTLREAALQLTIVHDAVLSGVVSQLNKDYRKHRELQALRDQFEVLTSLGKIGFTSFNADQLPDDVVSFVRRFQEN